MKESEKPVRGTGSCRYIRPGVIVAFLIVCTLSGRAAFAVNMSDFQKVQSMGSTVRYPAMSQPVWVSKIPVPPKKPIAVIPPWVPVGPIPKPSLPIDLPARPHPRSPWMPPVFPGHLPPWMQ